jgi:hypothetical protein
MKGVFNRRPALPRNQVTWDTNIVLDYLRKLSPVAKLTLSQLTKKVVTLLALLSGQRGQGLHLLDTRNITIEHGKVKLRYGDLTKTSRPGKHQGEITLCGYAPDRRLCIVTVLKEYIDRTEKLRGGHSPLFIAISKPHRPVSRDTVSRWIKYTLTAAGIDMSIFTPHSTRSASTSAAHRAKVPIGSILATAGWANSSTFAKYYNKPLNTQGVFSQKILEGTSGTN